METDNLENKFNKKIPLSEVKDDIILMRFDKNPNIPTTKYSEATQKNINESIKKKMKIEKMKKLVETELKKEEKIDKNDFEMLFNFKSM
jgi:hypothetical protein